MRVRLMTRADLPRVLDIHQQTFAEDELFVWMFPGKLLHPAPYRNYFLARFRTNLCTPGLWSCVCVDDDDNILGFCIWKRTVPDSMPDVNKSDPWLRNHASWAHWIEARLLQAQSKYNHLLITNSAMDYKNVRRVKTDDDPCLGPIEKVGPRWHCLALATAPEAQRRGVGSSLIDWGINAAREETEQRGVAVPLSLTASVSGKELYLKKGFRIVAWQKLGSEGNPTFEGGAALVWDPTNTWIKPAEPETEVKPGRIVQVVWTENTLQANA